MNHTENYKKYAYRSILIMMLGVVFFILFGSRLISQNVYASFDTYETYVDIVEFEKTWVDDSEEDRPDSITIEAKFEQRYNNTGLSRYITKTIELSTNNNWKDTIEFEDSDCIMDYVNGSIKEIKGAEGYVYTGAKINEYITQDANKKRVVTITLTNTKIPTGNLTISKDVNGNKGDINKDFHFTVQLSDSSINGTYGDMTFKDGVATFTLKDNERITATSLPTGINIEI